MPGVVDERVRGLDVLVDDALAVRVPECGRHADRDAKEASQVDRLSLVPIDDSIQGFTPGILENEDRSPLVTSEGERLRGPPRVELFGEGELVFEPPKTLGRRLLGSSSHRQDRQLVAAPSSAVESNGAFGLRVNRT